MLTESEALAILPLSVAKLELRIADSIKEHDALIQRQIWDAVNYCSESTGARSGRLDAAAGGGDDSRSPAL